MATPQPRRRPHAMARRVAGRLALGLLGAQATAVGGLVAMDQLRKRDRPEHEFPRVPPHELTVPGGTVTVYTYGEDLFEAMLSAIAGATERVFLETYLWKDDATGRRFKAAVTSAAARGVEVYLAYDVFANLVVPSEFLRFDPRIRVVRHPATHVARNHRKTLVVDGREAFVGGYNIGALYATRWRDTHARLTGDHAVEVENAFIDYWNAQGGQPEIPDVRGRSWESEIQVHRNVPSDLVFPIRNMYLEAIDRAESHIWLTHAYLIPDQTLLLALTTAARRGVDVRIIVPMFSNHVVADWLSRGQYGHLLAGGVRLLRFQGAMVHAKTATIDGRWSTIGTANLDRLSLAGNYEINVEILDPGVAAHMEQIFEVDSSNCAELTLEQWQARPWGARITEGVLSPWRSIL